jgi:DNA-binding response OmpR family regulator
MKCGLNDLKTKSRVMIAEREPFIAHVYAEKLSSIGYDVIVCTTPEQIIDEYQKQMESALLDDTSHLIVIVDEEFPCEELVMRQILSTGPYQKIIYTTTSNHVFALPGSSMIEILEKPFSINLLVNKLEELRVSCA